MRPESYKELDHYLQNLNGSIQRKIAKSSNKINVLKTNAEIKNDIDLWSDEELKDYFSTRDFDYDEARGRFIISQHYGKFADDPRNLKEQVKKLFEQSKEYSDEEEDKAQEAEKKSEDDLRYETEEILESIDDDLRELIDKVQIFIDTAKKFDRRLAGEAESYILGHLKAFKNNENQPGSIKSLYNGLTK